MKRFISGVVFVLLVGLFVSCASAPSGSGGLHRPLGPSEMSNFDIIGSVQITIENANTSKLDGSPTQANKEDAYIRLLAEAKKVYQRNDIDIRNISVISQSPLRSIANLSATGDVVVRAGSNNAVNATGVEGALARAAGEVSENFTARSRIAIVYITAEDKSQTDFIAGELEHILRRQGFIIIDRSELDKIRAEQRFGTSGEVDDNTAARIGNIAGASVVITGRVDGEGNLRRLRLRALNTDNGQVVGTASERL
jgi:hypothetical protein